MTRARYGLNILATLILGTLLARWFVHLPIETRIPVAIESALAFFGVDTIALADDIDGIGLLLVLAVCLVVAGLAVWGVNRVVRR
jgi:K+ transporter